MLKIFNRLLYAWPCHRLSERCFRIKNEQMSVCARCFGLIIGLPFGFLTGYLGIFSSRWLGLMFVIPLAIDGGTQYLGYRVSNNLHRIITGCLAGFGFGVFFLLWLIRDFHLLLRLFK
jgi:uncharacterized membrane protein